MLDIDYRPVLWGLAALGDGETRFAAADHVSANFQAILPLFDLIVGTEEEIHIAGGSTDTIGALRRIRELSDAIIVVKLGAEGLRIFSRPYPGRDCGSTKHPGAKNQSSERSRCGRCFYEWIHARLDQR